MTEIIGGIIILIGLAFVGYTLIWLFPSSEIGIGERLILGLVISLGLLPLLLFYGLLAGSGVGFFLHGP